MKRAPNGKRQSRQDDIIAMLKRKGGATLVELCEATGWQYHTMRGYLSTLNKRGTVALKSSVDAEKVRRYGA